MPATNWPRAASFSDWVSRRAQLLALGFELRLRRQVASHHDRAHAFALLVQKIGDGDHERAVEHRIEHLADGGTLPVRAHGRVVVRAQPRRQLGADALGQRLVEQLLARQAAGAVANASFACTIRPRRSDTTTRCAIESNVFSSSRRERITSSSSCIVSIEFAS